MGKCKYNGIILPELPEYDATEKTPFILYDSGLATLYIPDGPGIICLEETTLSPLGDPVNCNVYRARGYQYNPEASWPVTYSKYVTVTTQEWADSYQELYPGINQYTWLCTVENQTEERIILNYIVDLGEWIVWTAEALWDPSYNWSLGSSVPVLIYDLRAWLVGYAIGLAEKPIPLEEKESE